VKVSICGGGTAGHIYPALAIVAELKERGLTAEDFLWIGTRGEIEEKLVPRAGLPLAVIAAGGLAGLPWWKRMTNLAKLTWSLGSTTRLLRTFRPDVLLLTGGYVNGPVSLAAWLKRIPMAVYLPDVEPAMAIRAVSRLARKVACTAEMSRAYFPEGKAVVTGYPVRKELREATDMARKAALAAFDLRPERPTVLVFGGSRGSRSINRALGGIMAELLAKAQVIHITGELDWPEVEASAAALPAELAAFYRPYAYLHERMGHALRAADLAVSRAGASTLGELPAFGLPAILVPYPYAWRYQKVNADHLVNKGAALRVDDERLADSLLPTILSLLDDRARLDRMSAAASRLDVADSASRLADLLSELGQGRTE
jgi:undecaprenyldiphospho-muramoylpentapeptide beta-N-acetylglucosaminyltransferase